MANIRLNSRDFVDPSNAADVEKSLAELVKTDLAKMIVQEIISNELYAFSCEPDVTSYNGGRIYSMSICVVPPNEWMKTSFGNIMDPNVFRDYKF